MIPFVQRRPALLLFFLLLANLLLLSVQTTNAEGQVLLQAWGAAIRAPFASAVSLFGSRARSFLDRYVALTSAERENEKLRLENERLRLEAQRLRSLVGSALSIRGFERFARELEIETVPAAITQRSLPFESAPFQINAGSLAGVRRNEAVIRPEGVVGRLHAVTRWSAEVQPITHPEAGVGAVLEKSRAPGVIRGQGGDLVRMDYVPISVRVEVGERVLTSGTDRIYPKGLPIGEVTAVDKGNLVHQHIVVRPAVEISSIEEVLVVLARDSGQEGSEPAEAGRRDDTGGAE